MHASSASFLVSIRAQKRMERARVWTVLIFLYELVSDVRVTDIGGKALQPAALSQHAETHAHRVSERCW
jgi:hypothetical protein